MSANTLARRQDIYDFHIGWGNAPTPYISSWAGDRRWPMTVRVQREGHHLSEYQLLAFENGGRVADAMADPDYLPEFHFAGSDWGDEDYDCYNRPRLPPPLPRPLRDRGSGT